MADAAGRLHEELWAVALQAAELEPNPATTGHYIESLNAMIDAYGKRSAVLERHVPEIVLLLLFTVLIIAVSVLGYAGGLAGGRPIIATLAVSVLITLVVFIIIDLDRPRRGLINTNQENMVDLGAFPSDH